MAKDYLYSVAEIYAQAVYELAEEKQALTVIADDLAAISESVKADKEFEHFLASPSISGKDKLTVLNNVFADKVDELTMDFLKVLNARDRLETLVYINRAFITMLDKAHGRVEGLLTTAVELSEDEITQITKTVSDSLGKKVILTANVDPSIIGGMQLKIGNTSIDGSIRKQLTDMAARLSSHQPGSSAIIND